MDDELTSREQELWEAGYKAGKDDGRLEKDTNDYEEGYADGYDEGYEDGYDAGKDDAERLDSHMDRLDEPQEYDDYDPEAYDDERN